MSTNGNCGSLLPSFVNRSYKVKFSRHIAFPFFYCSFNFARTLLSFECSIVSHTKHFFRYLSVTSITSPSKTIGFLIRILCAWTGFVRSVALDARLEAGKLISHHTGFNWGVSVGISFLRKFRCFITRKRGLPFTRSEMNLRVTKYANLRACRQRPC